MFFFSDSGTTTVHRVSIEAEYTSDLDYFDFDSDMEPKVIARAMAREQWDRQYFSRLRSVLELTEIY